ncbi:uncharacterized protein LOC129800567 [Phlebotomus papatasi]|uniref:uncharacterized protein LOC129800567 n=1 Tax=Phlebotomus papatasi TaxID=29031 RepID=UPI0024840B4E|nr:uncharacterized protein LOC129800567 [Phlebotomus papatasi]
MRRQEFSQTRERLKLTMLESPRVSEDEVIVVDADDATDKEDEIRRRRWKSLLTATRNVLFMPNSLLGAEKVPYSYLRELIEVIGSTSKGSSVEYVADMWNIVLNLVSLMKATYEETKIDPEFKLITIDLLTHYVNYKARITQIEINHRSITANELERKREDLYMKIFLLLDGAIEDILMLLMNLDVKKEYDGMLYPLFKNILTNPKFHKNIDSISYVRRILCFRKWKILTLLRKEKEIIYEYADKIIPQVIPKANNDSRMFFEILSPVATKRKTQPTRSFLKSKYVDVQKQVQDFFRLWRRSLSDQDMINERFSRDIINSLPEVEESVSTSSFLGIFRFFPATFVFNQHKKSSINNFFNQHIIFNQHLFLFSFQFA